MDHATCFRLLSATHFVTSLLPLTVRLIPVLTAIGRLIGRFRRAKLTPQVCHQFETQLLAQFREWVQSGVKVGTATKSGESQIWKTQRGRAATA